jgi:hypothetical protein
MNGGLAVKLLEILLIGAALLIGLKLLIKTLKFVSILAIVGAAMLAFWLWQHGMLPF